MLWGFLNFELALGLSLGTLAAAERARASRAVRAALLLAMQPVLFVCHLVGSLVLPVALVAMAIGEELDARHAARRDGQARPPARLALARIAASSWPCLPGLLLALAWSAAPHRARDGGASWNAIDKLTGLAEVLRDQSRLLDVACALVALQLAIFAPRLGATTSWRSRAPMLAFLAMVAVLPGQIGSGALLDVRFVPVALMFGLALADWHRARPPIRRLLVVAGFALLALRIALLANGFATYARQFDRQLAALDHVPTGSRIAAFVDGACAQASWRLRRDGLLPTIAAARRQAWINLLWADPAVDPLVYRADPRRHNPVLPLLVVDNPRCAPPGSATIDTVLAATTLTDVDFLWLVGTGPPRSADPRLRLAWQSGGDVLYTVTPGSRPAQMP